MKCRGLAQGRGMRNNVRKAKAPICLMVFAASVGAKEAPEAGATLPVVTVTMPALDPDDPRVQASTSATGTLTRLRDVPQTVDTVKVEQALAYGPTTLGTLLDGVPNVSNASDTRFDSLRIRGFDASNDLYRDGVRDDAQYVRDLHNIERVDVLKGPSGALFGRGSKGGIVNRISKVPDAGLSPSVEAQWGTEETASLYADLPASLGDTVKLRLNLGGGIQDGYRTGQRDWRTLFAPAILWDITPQLTALVQYEFSEYRRTPDRGVPSLGNRPAPVGRHTLYGDPERDYIDDQAQTLRARLGYRLGEDWQLRYTFDAFWLDSQFDNTYQRGYHAASGRVTRQRFQQALGVRNLRNQIEAEGSLSTGRVQHRLLAGLEFTNQHRSPTLWNAATRGPGAMPVPSLDLFHPDLTRQHRGRMDVYSDADHAATNSAIYLQDQLSFGYGFQALVGLRADAFRVTSTDRLRNRTGSSETNALSPRLSLLWSPVPSQTVYATYSKTFSPTGGGLIGAATNASGNANDVGPEHTRLYEMGWKGDWLAGRLTSTLSLFQIDLYNRRTQDPDDPSRILLTGLQRSQGVEASLLGRVTGSWYLRSGIGLQNASIVKDNNGFAGKRVSNAPRRNGSLFVSYLPKQGTYGEAGLTLVGARYADRVNQVVMPGYGRLDAMIGYRARMVDYRLTLRNLLNKTYFSSATSGGQIQYGEPFMLMSTVTARF